MPSQYNKNTGETCTFTVQQKHRRSLYLHTTKHRRNLYLHRTTKTQEEPVPSQDKTQKSVPSQDNKNTGEICTFTRQNTGEICTFTGQQKHGRSLYLRRRNLCLHSTTKTQEKSVPSQDNKNTGGALPSQDKTQKSVPSHDNKNTGEICNLNLRRTKKKHKKNL